MSIYAPPPVGSVVQSVSTPTTAVATGTTTIPFDDTIPQNTEGDQYMSLAITPTSSTNNLYIYATFVGSSTAAVQMQVALFQDTTANALAVAAHYQSAANGMVTVNLFYSMAAGTTSSTTFKIRAGGDAAGTTTFNGQLSGRKWGAIAKSSMSILEVKV